MSRSDNVTYIVSDICQINQKYVASKKNFRTILQADCYCCLWKRYSYRVKVSYCNTDDIRAKRLRDWSWVRHGQKVKVSSIKEYLCVNATKLGKSWNKPLLRQRATCAT